RWAPAVSPVGGTDTVRSRRGKTDSPAHDATHRSSSPVITTSLQLAPLKRRYPKDRYGHTGRAKPRSEASPSPPLVPARAPRTLRNPLKNWRVRSRLLLLVVLRALSAVILGGVSVASSVRSAVAYQRVERLSRLGGEITRLIQALQAEREDTIRYITM